MENGRKSKDSQMVGDYGVEEWKDGGKCRMLLSMRDKKCKIFRHYEFKICFQWNLNRYMVSGHSQFFFIFYSKRIPLKLKCNHSDHNALLRFNKTYSNVDFCMLSFNIYTGRISIANVINFMYDFAFSFWIWVSFMLRLPCLFRRLDGLYTHTHISSFIHCICRA